MCVSLLSVFCGKKLCRANVAARPWSEQNIMLLPMKTDFLINLVRSENYFRSKLRKIKMVATKIGIFFSRD